MRVAGRRPARQGRTQVQQGGGARVARARHLSRGKLLPRERVRALLDPGSPFLELSQLAAYGMYDDEMPGCGHHHRHRPGRGPRMRDRRQRRDGQGRHLLSDDGEEASAGAGDRAARTDLPCIYLVDCGGANLPNQDEVFPDRDHFGRIFYNQANMSAQGIPQIAVVMGSLHGGRRLCAGDVGRDRSSCATRARSSWAARRW